jgi:ATP-binding cassette subfamily B protein
MNGQVSIYVLLIFLIASASIYAPVENGLMFLSEILMMDIKIDRSKDIEAQVIPEGLKDYSL